MLAELVLEMMMISCHLAGSCHYCSFGHLPPPDNALAGLLAGLLAGCLKMVIVTTVVEVKVTLSACSFLLLPVAPACWRRPLILLLDSDISSLLMVMMAEKPSNLSLCSLCPESVVNNSLCPNSVSLQPHWLSLVSILPTLAYCSHTLVLVVVG